MKISDEKLSELKEEYYLKGQRMLLLSQLGDILRQLSITEDVTRERMILEREQAIQSLRSICSEHGDNDWDERLHLSDIIDKHLGRYLYDKR